MMSSFSNPSSLTSSSEEISNDAVFFHENALDKEKTIKSIGAALQMADDGELFLEQTLSESLSLEDGNIKSATFDVSQGFGLRSVIGEATAYAHASELSPEALERAIKTTQSLSKGYAGIVDLSPQRTNQHLYTDHNPLQGVSFEKKVALLSQIDAFSRDLDPRIQQVMVSLAGEWQRISILRSDGSLREDIRPLVRLSISLLVSTGNRMETGSYSGGGRFLYDRIINEETWQVYAKEALRQALLNCEAIPAPAGEMPVVVGPGWPGVLLHEAVGHGLEGDFNRKKSSVFSDSMGKQVASKGVTVIDDGTLPDRRGSLTIDDEGTPTERTVLIEDGILVGYMQDRLNARLMGMKPTGNGRRENYTALPFPRMTNTFMLNGSNTQEDMIHSVKNGIYAANFAGGQVDITSGNFVFSASEAYLIENGKVTSPIKGATLIGNGPDIMRKITMIGNDMCLDSGMGTCGKNGQSVPVGVGQPSLLISALTVGGTSLS
ncbi:MAG: metalloprotease TldD [Alphaproteobacteria bacterium 16-39-46]|nr:MAG: metalloprotease TldD [Alphaproteobacteria bacterium 16-39-46]OZA43908.1 MAG: metalloprotease TldD [Alphaproteobacteria bacterium 17-39-52]HQS83698.1 metalloprotease TldD [Alphaproteobacteria bacterium]HQS93466.1 metalloprotease TldD [Alphaproteobacteria bacterium]